VGNNQNGNISNCYSTGNITGGIESRYLGGLAGNTYNSDISNCYTTGLVSSGSGSTFLGGLVGNYLGGTISRCYFLEGSGPDNGLGEPLTDAEMKKQASFVGWDFAGERKNGVKDIWWIAEGASYPQLIWVDVTKCTVKAGKKDNSDKISISGQLDTGANYYFRNGNVIEITIKSKYMLNYCEPSFDINDKTFKKGKYSYSATENGVKRSFKYNTKTRKFIFSASNVDLSGLSCPVTMHLSVGGYYGSAVVDEDIANGKKPIPISLMMGVKNSLRVDKIKVKKSKKPNRSQLTVKGGFAVKNGYIDMSSVSFHLAINDGIGPGWGFNIPVGKFKVRKNGFTYSGPTNEGSIVSANFDFLKCAFTLKLKNTSVLVEPGEADFRMVFGDFDESVEVLMP
jgi:hypothetical protein